MRMVALFRTGSGVALNVEPKQVALRRLNGAVVFSAGAQINGVSESTTRHYAAIEVHGSIDLPNY